MQTKPVTPEQFRSTVLAVPPLARDSELRICKTENEKIVRHIESGGVSSLLYGGNANLYHVRLSEYAILLEVLAEIAGDETLIIPSVGPAYGIMMDQAQLLRESDFPTAMVLPGDAVMTEEGLMTGFRHFVEAYERPAVLYIKRDGYLSPKNAAKLVDDKLVSIIKYATVRDDPSDDDYLKELVDCVDRSLIVSGIGEQPAIVHLKEFGLNGFTSGCVCVAPALSQKMLAALYADDIKSAEQIRQAFMPLEDLRNEINPIRVLHEAVELADIAKTGPHLPMLSGIDEADRQRIEAAAKGLKE